MEGEEQRQWSDPFLPKSTSCRGLSVTTDAVGVVSWPDQHVWPMLTLTRPSLVGQHDWVEAMYGVFLWVQKEGLRLEGPRFIDLVIRGWSCLSAKTRDSRNLGASGLTMPSYKVHGWIKTELCAGVFQTVRHFCNFISSTDMLIQVWHCLTLDILNPEGLLITTAMPEALGDKQGVFSGSCCPCNVYTIVQK